MFAIISVMTRPKVMVNILNMGEISAGLETQMIQWMREYTKDYDFQIFIPSARPISNNRNQIAEKFLAGDWDYLFMLDDDTIPQTNPFKMLKEDKDVIGGCYPGKDDHGFHYHVYNFGENFTTDRNKKFKKGEIFFTYISPEEREGVRKVGAVATGCMLIKRHVLEKIKEKGWAPFEDMFDEQGILMTNDDMAFCIKCWRLGIDVYADWSVIADHIKKCSLLAVLRFIEYAARTGKPRISMNDEDYNKYIL